MISESTFASRNNILRKESQLVVENHSHPRAGTNSNLLVLELVLEFKLELEKHWFGFFKIGLYWFMLVRIVWGNWFILVCICL